MKTIKSHGVADTKRSFSKIDATGTDPNRYASVSNPEEAEQFRNTLVKKSKNSKTVVPGLTVNVGTFERILMVAAGSYLLYKALSGNKKSVSKSVAGGTMLFRGVSGYCPVYDVIRKSGKLKATNVNIRTSVTIDKPAQEVYDFWRNLENLPKFMSHLKKVEEVDRITSEWTANGPGKIGQVSWRAQILMDEPGEMLSWSSLPGSTIDNAGKVVFRSAGESQTVIDVTISYHAPLGVAGEAAAKMLNPMFENIVTNDIENLKSVLEADAPAMA
ncbi:MAG TPA: SRPBCC family protein [Flavobacterium sp.]|jgi:uncharacterized membrane protein